MHVFVLLGTNDSTPRQVHIQKCFGKQGSVTKRIYARAVLKIIRLSGEQLSHLAREALVVFGKVVNNVVQRGTKGGQSAIVQEIHAVCFLQPVMLHHTIHSELRPKKGGEKAWLSGGRSQGSEGGG